MDKTVNPVCNSQIRKEMQEIAAENMSLISGGLKIKAEYYENGNPKSIKIKD